MTTGTRDKTDKKDRPLTREDVEQLLQQAGSPDKLNLSGMNLQGTNLTGFNLAKTILHNADLRKADLRKADLSYADLRKANLSGANLSGAYLFEANLRGADLRGADLRGADLSYANLFGADLGGANLGGANLRGADLGGAELRNAKLSGVDLHGANLADTKIDEGQLGKAQLEDKALLHNIPILGSLSDDQDFFRQKIMYTTEEWAVAVGVTPIRITEDPLTSYNLAIALTALTELTTKLWLIAKRRFDDLIEYTQTHDARFAKEAGSTIAYATFNSPFNFGFQVDKLVPSVADATMTVVNGLTQRKAKLEQLELENQAAAQKLKEAEQKAQQEQQMAALELEKQRLAIEKERQALVEQRLDAQKKRIEDSLELANKAVDTVYPNVDAEMRSVLIQTIMNNILQLQNVTGLELALQPPKKEEENS